MRAILLDTHAWAWSLTHDDKLSTVAIAHIRQADAVFVSPISFYEIGQKVRIGKWPEMAPFVTRLTALLDEQGGRLSILTPEIALAASMLDWTHRDPFDRLLAATALQTGQLLVSADTVFDGLASSALTRIW